MHIDCKYCEKTIYGDSSELNRLLQEHIQRYHAQGYRRSDSWLKCRNCNGTGKDVYGRVCPICHGSGIV